MFFFQIYKKMEAFFLVYIRKWKLLVLNQRTRKKWLGELSERWTTIWATAHEYPCERFDGNSALEASNNKAI